MTVERMLADLIRAEHPAEALAEALDDPTTPPELRDALRHVDPDGLTIAALLVARLRFERLIQGSTSAAAWFDTDPAGFTRAFRRYHRRVAPTAQFPAAEAELFERFVASENRRSKARGSSPDRPAVG